MSQEIVDIVCLECGRVSTIPFDEIGVANCSCGAVLKPPPGSLNKIEQVRVKLHVWKNSFLLLMKKRAALKVEKYEALPLCKICDKGRLRKHSSGDSVSEGLGCLLVIIAIPMLFSILFLPVGIIIILCSLRLLLKTKKSLACDNCGASVPAK